MVSNLNPFAHQKRGWWGLVSSGKRVWFLRWLFSDILVRIQNIRMKQTFASILPHFLPRKSCSSSLIELTAPDRDGNRFFQALSPGGGNGKSGREVKKAGAPAGRKIEEDEFENRAPAPQWQKVGLTQKSGRKWQAKPAGWKSLGWGGRSKSQAAKTMILVAQSGRSSKWLPEEKISSYTASIRYPSSNTQ